MSTKQWCSKAFKNVNVVPPDVGAVHQVNLEYLSRVIQVSDGFIYPDSVVGTDSHTTMINGLGILGWGKPFLNCSYDLLTFWSSCTSTVIYNNVFSPWGVRKVLFSVLWKCLQVSFFPPMVLFSTRSWRNRVRSRDAGPASVSDPSSGGGLQTGGLYQSPDDPHRRRTRHHKGNTALLCFMSHYDLISSHMFQWDTVEK